MATPTTRPKVIDDVAHDHATKGRNEMTKLNSDTAPESGKGTDADRLSLAGGRVS